VTETTSRAVTCQGRGHLRKPALSANLRHVTPAASLKALRLRAGLTQEALAEKAGIDRSWLNQMETGKRPITRSPAAKLAAVFGVSPAELGAEKPPLEPKYRSLLDRQEALEGDVRELVALTTRLGRRVAALERRVPPAAAKGEETAR